MQLNSDLPDKFPGHERRVYLFGCRKKACRRKDGSVRGIRTTRISAVTQDKAASEQSPPPTEEQPKPKQTNIGESLFGVKPSQTNRNANPFSSPGSAAANPFSSSSKPASNPFAPAPTSSQSIPAKAVEKVEDLTATFAEKARIAVTNDDVPNPPTGPAEPWPSQSAFPDPYPAYYIDADKEYLDSEPPAIPQNIRMAEAGEFETTAGNSSKTSSADEKAAADHLMDTTFQRFADRLAQNPEQVLRYDFGGQPLLYSKKDAVGSQWPRVPRCGKCGAERVFELQLTPHAIAELEADDLSLEGMDWGTIVLASCGADCGGSVEEWVGVQWEELTSR